LILTNNHVVEDAEKVEPGEQTVLLKC